MKKHFTSPRIRSGLILLFIVLYSLPAPVSAQTEPEQKGIQSLLFTSDNMMASYPAGGTASLREIRAIVFSTLIPGAGQTYLGHFYKGLGFTLGFYGTGLMAVLSHSNFIGREDRIRSLLIDYQAAVNFDIANAAWKEIEKEKSNRELDYKKRTIYSIAAAAIWAANVVDILYFSDDTGTTEFSFFNGGVQNFASPFDTQLFGIKINL